MSELSLFAACLPGLEDLLAAEVAALGTAPRPEPGGVSFAGDVDLLLRAHLHLGLASHLLLRCGSFHCRSLGELRRKTARLPWHDWLLAATPLAVRAVARRSRLFHTGAIAERVGQGIADALGAPPPLGVHGAAAPGEDEAAIQVAVRFLDDTAMLSLDTSATPLHQRGYRLAGAKAPLREDLARALLRAAGYLGTIALLDPFCGAGTIAIEAALLATGTPPGRLRPPPLRGTALADDDRWRQLVATAAPAPPRAPIHASDRDRGAIAAATDNAARAGSAAAVELRIAPFTAAPWLLDPQAAPAQGLLATNPPFGKRIGKQNDLAPLYQTLGHRVRRLGPGWRMALLAHDLRLARRTGLPLQVAFVTRHGGLRIAAMVTPP